MLKTRIPCRYRAGDRAFWKVYEAPPQIPTVDHLCSFSSFSLVFRLYPFTFMLVPFDTYASVVSFVISDSFGHGHSHLRLVYKTCCIYSNIIIRSHYSAHVVRGTTEILSTRGRVGTPDRGKRSCCQSFGISLRATVAIIKLYWINDKQGEDRRTYPSRHRICR